MRTFKKVILSALSLLLVVIVLSLAVCEPAFHSEYRYYQDAYLRKRLSGSIDFVLTGASNGLCAFAPYVADELLGVNSFNLSGASATWYDRQLILEKELARNPIKTVVVEISFNTFSRAYHDSWGDYITVNRLDSLKERVTFLTRYVSIRDFDTVYALMLGNGIAYDASVLRNFIKTRLLHRSPDSLNGVPDADKGLHALESGMTEEAENSSDSSELELTVNPKNYAACKAMIELCQSKGIDVILSVMPYSDAFLLEHSGWDEMFAVWQQLSQETGCALYDCNKLLNRSELFEDAQAFRDGEHMTRTGAEAYTRVFCELIRARQNGEDISGRFYPSYAQMLRAIAG